MMEECGWKVTESGSWVREFYNSSCMQVPPAGQMKRRVTRDAGTGELIEDSHFVAGSADRRATRALRRRRDLAVEVYIDAVEFDKPIKPVSDMNSGDQSKYRAITARVNFLAQDRGELGFASKECSRKMSCPMAEDFGALKRIGRYLLKVPRVVIMYEWQEKPTHLAVYTDSGWAGCVRTRRSTSGACLLHGAHLLKSYSRTQSTVALSSAEAELYATVTAASEGLGMAAMCEEYRHPITPWINVDASAAIGIAQRKELGKVRHLNTQSLWIQDAVREKRVQLEKVGGNLNPADLFTKHVPAEVLQRHMARVGLNPQDGRAATAPKLVKGDANVAMEVDGEATVDSLEIDDGAVESEEDNSGIVSIARAATPGTPGDAASAEGREARLPMIRGNRGLYAASAIDSKAQLGTRLDSKAAKSGSII